MTQVDLSPIEKDLYKLPSYIVLKLMRWIDGIEKEGIDYMRNIPGFNDEALKGKRQGQRSIRLNNAYRAIYVEIKMDKFVLIRIEEVNKHEY